MSISSVTSEALQLKLRELLPSQQGFGTDLSASDTIIPVIDLTRAAEGSDIGENLQTALNFGGATVFDVANTSTTIANTAGFYRIVASVVGKTDSTTNVKASFNLNDGSTDKIIYSVELKNENDNYLVAVPVDLVVFLRNTDQFSVISNDLNIIIGGSIRQIADVNGTLVNPVGFTPQ